MTVDITPVHVFMRFFNVFWVDQPEMVKDGFRVAINIDPEYGVSLSVTEQFGSNIFMEYVKSDFFVFVFIFFDNYAIFFWSSLVVLV